MFFFSEESIHINLNFLLDVLAVVSKDSHIYSIPSLLLDSAVYQLDQVKRCLLKQSEVIFYWFLFVFVWMDNFKFIGNRNDQLF